MEDMQEYCVKHNSHQTSVLENIYKLRDSGTLVDCLLKVDSKYMKAHKLILAASSVFFANLFNNCHQEESIFAIKNMTFEELRTTVDFIYKGEIVIRRNQLKKFLEIAKTFQIKGFFETGTFVHSIENNSKVPQQKTEECQNNCKRANMSSDSPELGEIEKLSSIVDELLQDSSLYSSLSKGMSCRKDSGNSDLEEPILQDRIGDSICVNQQEQIVPPLEWAPVNDITTHFAKNIQQNSQHVDIPKGSMDYCSLNDDLTEMKDVSFKDFLYREDLQNLNIKNNKEGKISDIDSTDITQEQSIIPTLKITNKTADTSHETGKKVQLNSRSSATHYVKRERIKTEISDEKDSKKASSQNSRVLEKGNYSCPQCEHTYKNLTSLRGHLKYECGGKEPQFQCDICKQMVKRRHHLVRHMRTVHNEERKNHTCQQCGTSYTRKDNLISHLKDICGKEPKFECDICHQKVKRKKYLLNHMVIHNIKRETYSCPWCNNTYISKNYFHRHLKHKCLKKQ